MSRLIAAIAAFLFIATLPATAQPIPVLADPPRDAAHPARNQQLVIPSGPVLPALRRPAEMNALFLLAAGAGPHPTMILLHGLPGNERNLDLAQAVRRAGWNVLTFTYRGAWGSEGIFSIEHAVIDGAAALAFLRRPEIAARYGVDTRRLVIAGHSTGGYIAAHVAAHDPATGAAPLAGVILLDAWNIGAEAAGLQAGGARAHAAFIAGIDDLGHALGPVTAEDLYQSLLRRGRDWQLTALAPALTRLPVLSIYATHGDAAPNRAFADLLRRTGTHVTAEEMDTDHPFADHRLALAASVIAWLEGLR